VSTPDPLRHFSPPTREWFAASFAAPTEAQARAWEATASGASVLVSAPTGSGKTLAAFLAALDRLMGAPTPERSERTRVLYVSPLKALAYDVDRNLRAPLVGITRAAERRGVALSPVDVAIRSGDTPPEERRRMARQPPDILITTPESLFLLLTSKARETLASVETVIVDEVHAVAATKRGAHLALSLERLEALVGVDRLQRVGLSATQRPLDEVARYLGGGTVGDDGVWTPRPVEIVEATTRKELDVEIVVPVEDMSRLGEVLPDEPAHGPAAGASESRRSIWPAVHPRILDLIDAHSSTIVFANSRRLAERLCAKLNELHLERGALPPDTPRAPGTDGGGGAWQGAGALPPDTPRAPGAEGADGDAPPPEVEPIARAHHGSVAREQRVLIEEALKSGELRCVVATSSLELGIDMGAVDLVIQVESPGSVASGLQRVGRAGHQVGAPSVGKVFPKFRGDLVECAVVVRRMRDGEIELTRYPRNPLDVLAQQVVAMTAMDAWPVDEVLALVRSAASFAELSRTQLDGVLDMLSGRYPSDEFAELRPRLTWDRVEDVLRGRPGAQRLAVTSGGTIPDRGLYGVFLAGAEEGSGGRAGGRRVGELDEEMVYETRPGETIVLGSSTWRIEDITRDQVLVTPAPGQPGKLPFWHGDALGRPVEVGRAVGAFLREVATSKDHTALQDTYGLDELAAANLAAYLDEQREATGVVPSDRTIVIERFRDEIGDWRVVVHSPFGGRVHAPWALAIEARARERLGLEVQTMYADDGIVVRIPEADEALPAETVLVDAADVEDLVVGELSGSALFASRFRECAARALLLPRRRPGGRTPLWQQRQKAADLLQVAGRYGSFPILLETYREVLRDVFDLPALLEVLTAIASREIHVVQVETPVASPFASSLLFDYVAGYMYEGDAPLAERRASALTLDRELLAELLGSDELRELIDPDALDELELELQRMADGRLARNIDEVHDLLREIGDLRTDEVAARSTVSASDVARLLAALGEARRAFAVRIAGEERWVAAEDAARFRDGLGVPPPTGLPEVFLQPVDRPLIDLVARYARTHGPFHSEDVATRLGLPRDAVELALAQLEADRRLVTGAFRPAGRSYTSGLTASVAREWCDAEVLRRIRRRSLAALRREVEPVEPEALARFMPAWQGVSSRPSGVGSVDRTFEVVEQLQGAPIPASVLERDVLPARIPGYTPAWLDELSAAGEIVWVGRGPLGSDDGRIGLYLRDQAPLLAPLPPDKPQEEVWWTDAHAALLSYLEGRGASFWPALAGAAADGGAPDDASALEALWDLVWAGVVTNDTLAPVRALVGGGVGRARGARRGRRAPRALARSGPPRAVGRWSLVAELLGPVSPTERGAALAAQLLDRYGVVTRQVAVVEDVRGGFSGVYPVLKAMEESGRARRGYFVEGMGGAQFAVPGAIDRLRAVREQDTDEAAPLVLAATDPANPYGGVLSWPEPSGAHRHAPKRAAGAHVVVVGGQLILYAEKGGRSLVTFTPDEDALAAAAGALAELVTSGRLRQLQLQRIDAEDIGTQPVVALLREAGFLDHPRGLVLRR
jgi:ATP-dependent helicase Lhr and Lhr-like helicase